MAHICAKITGRRTAALALLLAGLWAGAANAATGKTAAFPLDLIDGDRVSAGTEELTFSNLWDGDAEATVTIAQDGAAIFTGLSGEGVKTWSVDRDGRYVLTHTTYTNGAPGKVETAVFVVEGKEVPVGELTVEWETGSYKYDNAGKTPGVTAKDGETLLVKGTDYTVHYEGNTNAGTAKAILTGLPPYVGSVTNEFTIAKRVVGLTSGSASKSYDGTPLVCHSVITNGDGFVSGEGVELAFTGSQTTVGTSKNAFDYTFKTGTLAGNYTITKTEGDLKVTSGEIVNPFDPDDPTNPATSEDLAKANCITNYDGDGHSVEVAAFLNPLIAANNPKITYSLLRDGTYEAQKPVFTNVVSTSVWYRIEADNFTLFTTNALLKILPRSITNVNVVAIADQTYTGFGVEPIPAVTDMRTLIGLSEPTDILSSADYDLSYLNNTNVGTAKVVLSGKNNYEGSQTNTFQIVPAIIPPGPTGAIVATGYTNAYDGAAHGVSVSVTGLKTQPTVQYKSSPSAEWQGDSPTYTDVCDTQVWWKVSAPNYQSVEGTIGLKITQAANAWMTEPAIDGWTYGETAKTPVGAAKFGEVAFTYDPMPVGAAGNYTMTATVAGTANYTGLSKTVPFTISKATLPGGGEEPGGGTVPEGGLSKFDTVAMYDGEGHTIKTNDLVAAFKAAVGGEVAVEYAYGGAEGPALPWMPVAPDFTNVCVTSVWYKVVSANYLDFVHEARVTVTNRPVTLTSGTKLDFTYDGKPHAYTNLTVTAGSFVAGEGIATSNWATVTTVAEGEVPNAFDFEAEEGTKLSNYALTVVTGRIAVVSPDAVVVTVTGHVASVVYDGLKKSVSGYDIVSISDPLYTAADFKFTGQSATNGTNAGTYPMGLKSADFANTNPNFASVVFNVTDGKLVISQAANAWTTEPAIDGWTYGETAKTPVGAAKFGEVAFAYDPMPVGAAGDYTLTATVAGTANYTGLSKTVDFTISKATLPGGGEEPGGGTVPEGGLSKFDTVAMYDGEGHTIRTNDLVAAFKAAVGGEVAVSYARGGAEGPVLPWMAVAPDFTNVCVTSVWYKVASANYQDFTHEGKVTVTNRPVTVTSGTKLDFAYDGKPHAYTNLMVTAGSFVAGEGIATSNWATVTTVAEGEVPNAFDYTPLAGTKLSNYDLTVVTGMIAVVSPDAVVVTVTGHVANVTYDGTKKSVGGYDVVSISDPLYTAADFTFAGQSATNGTDAGTYPMGLKSTDFANTNPNFATVVFNVTDGKLVISQAQNVWTTEPAIGGWTYGETAKTPVGAAKFGEVTFAYSPAAVGPAGDYTMTASVVDTANYTGLSKTVDFTIAKAKLPDEEPGGGTVPEGGASKFDTVVMYDGEGHAIATNDLVAAFRTAIGNDFAVSYALGESGGLGGPALPPMDAGAWLPVASDFTNVCVTSVWYKVASANYQDFTHEAKVTITNRPVALTSGTKLDFTYDGKPHAYTNLTVTAGSFVAGEGIATSNWATVTAVAEGQVPNAFDYEAQEGTLLSNYALTVVTGRIAVVSPDAVVVTVTGHVASVVYDGLKKSVSGYDVVSISDPLYTAADFKFTGQSATNGTDAGTYPMGLKSSDFANTNPNFASVVFNVTDGALVIAQAANAWTTEPAIEGWTYGETAKTPVGAAKFGAVSFAYDPMPVGAAGDYTMTASVVGTANYAGLSKTVPFTISKAELPGGGEEPGGGTVPEGGVSKFDTVAMYDGEGWTIKTNEMRIAFAPYTSGEDAASPFRFAASSEGPWGELPTVVTNVGTTSVWYKFSSANYLDFTHEAKVTVTNRLVTLTSGSESFDYDGNAHSNMTVAVSGEGFVAGEGVTSNNFATITEKGTKPNAFDYELILNPGSVAENYFVTCVTGALTVAAVANAWIVEPTVTDKAYDGTPAAVTMGTPRFGTVSVSYDGGQSAAPVVAGNHTAKFTVAATADYGALEKVIGYAITKAVFPGGGEEPGGGTVPEGGVSKFDTIAMYDGEGHTIKTNEMRIAFAPYTSGEDAASPFRFAASSEGPWGELPTVVTNVGTTSVWYKFSSANYRDFVHEAKVTITNRPVTLTSGTKLDFTYDGKPHAYTNLTVTAGSFVAGEGIATSNWATVTTVAEGQVPNAFDYETQEGTLLSNYALTVVTGKIAVVSPDAVVVMVTGHVASVVYDGLKKSVCGYDVVSISDPLYTAADFKFTGQSATNGTNAGTYPMGLKSAGFENTNPNFASVVFNVTDGRLVIAQAANTWTTEPAIDDWTYGETAKTPVGAAKFGEVAFAYDPMPVDAAGDYTMTASVVGTANYTGLSKTVDFTIAKATLPGGGEEPGGGSVPEGGVSKFDTVTMYDGTGWTIKTNDLIAAFRTAIGDDFAVSFAAGESSGQGLPVLPWAAVAPAYTNVGEYIVWYKVSSANYEDFAHEARVAVTNRPVTLTSGTESFDYDGNAHSNMTVTVGGEGFVAGEGVTSNNFATITEKGTKPNAFDYELILNPGSIAENYFVTCVTGALTVAAVANAWIVEPTVTDKAYDGTPAAVTMGTPRFGTVFVSYDGGQSAAPVVAGNHTAKFTVAATADYGALEKVIGYAITKAAFPGGGEEPGGGSVPEDGVSKFDTVAMYDGEGHTIKTNELVAAFRTAIGDDFTVSYAKEVGAWVTVAPVCTNVGEYVVRYKVASANYQDFTHEAKVTVMPRDISNVTIGDIPDQQHTGLPIMPTVTVTDGDPSIISADDYDVSCADNVDVGQATVNLTGKRNYTGTKTLHFTIKGSGAAALRAEIAWKLLKASGTYMAQLKVTCTSGLAAGISDLRFMFADRVSDGVMTAALWDTPNRAAKSTTMTYGGDTYRYVALDASRIMTENAPATYGVSNLAASSIPVAERTIELYVRTRVDPSADADNYIGYVSWVSGGETIRIPVPVGGTSAFLALLSDFNDCGLSGDGVVKRPAVNKSTGYLKEKANASWSATPDAGSVFAGWSAVSDAPECVASHLAAFSANELKSKKLTFKVGAGERIAPTHVAAAWARIDEDKIRRVALTAAGLEVDCKSYVTATVSGLPKGLKFNAKTLALEGVLKAKDVVYAVKVSIKNASGYTWKGSFPITVAGGVVTEIAPAVGVVATGASVMIDCDGTLGKVTGTKVYVAGKKASIRATPTKEAIFLGWYEDAAFVTPATGLPKGYLAAAQSVVVPAEGLNLYARFVKLDDWAVGAFDGIFYDANSSACGTVTLMISSKGKMSGKIQSGGKVYAFNAAAFDDARMIDGELAFVAHPTVKEDGEVRTMELFVTEGAISGLGSAVIFCGDEADAPFARAVQNGWKMKPVALPAFSTKKDARTSIVADGLTLTFTAKGAVRVSGKVDGRSVVATTQVLPVAWSSDINHDMLAQVGVYIPLKSEFGGFCKVYDVSLTVGTDGKFESVR